MSDEATVTVEVPQSAEARLNLLESIAEQKGVILDGSEKQQEELLSGTPGNPSEEGSEANATETKEGEGTEVKPVETETPGDAGKEEPSGDEPGKEESSAANQEVNAEETSSEGDTDKTPEGDDATYKVKYKSLQGIVSEQGEKLKAVQFLTDELKNNPNFGQLIQNHFNPSPQVTPAPEATKTETPATGLDTGLDMTNYDLTSDKGVLSLIEDITENVLVKKQNEANVRTAQTNQRQKLSNFVSGVTTGAEKLVTDGAERTAVQGAMKTFWDNFSNNSGNLAKMVYEHSQLPQKLADAKKEGFEEAKKAITGAGKNPIRLKTSGSKSTLTETTTPKSLTECKTKEQYMGFMHTLKTNSADWYKGVEFGAKFGWDN